jgi:heme/copper-type cytochrome/quinol oxidase subunit 2
MYEPMSIYELLGAIFIIFVLTVLVIITYRAQINRERLKTQTVNKRLLEVIGQRDALAQMYLLEVISPEKIEKVPESPSTGLTFSYKGGLSGLVASNLSPEEKEMMDAVDALMDNRIKTDNRGNYKIP